MEAILSGLSGATGGGLGFSPLALWFGGGDQRGGELFVEGKQVFHPVPVAGEGLGPVTAVPGVPPIEHLVHLFYQAF